MLKVFYIFLHALLYVGATFSFVNLLVAKKFYIFPDILHQPFTVSTIGGEPVVSKSVYRYCPIMFPNRVSYVELVELDIIDLMSFWVWICFMLVLSI